MTAAQLPDFDREIAQASANIAEIKRKMADVIAYISKRAELTFSQLKMNRVEISLYDVVKSTGKSKTPSNSSMAAAGTTGSLFRRRSGPAWRSLS